VHAEDGEQRRDRGDVQTELAQLPSLPGASVPRPRSSPVWAGRRWLNAPVRRLRYVVADVFTDRPLTGNQLAVFTDARDVDPAVMQALAREMNFSETVFVLPAEGDAHVRIRIFTPVNELRFAGHPVLGTAFVLAAPMQLGVIALEMGAGVVPVELTRDESGRIVFGRMTQPVPRVEPFERQNEVLAAVGVDAARAPVEVYDNGVRHAFVVLDDVEAVSRVAPDRAARLALGELGVSCSAGNGSRWRTRMFAPALGVDEDPATGSAAGPLACHLARHGLVSWGDELEIEQGAELGRPARLFARAEGGDGLIDRVEVGGSAVVVARGEFAL
jgi:trans-2,3-dihydro-3-hydroxyanthranilate isomerase